MKTKVEIIEYTSGFKKGQKGYIDGYVRGKDNRGYAVVIVGKIIDFAPLHQLRVIDN